MGFHLTESPSGESHPTAKNRVRGFFGEQPNLRREKSAATKQPRQGNPSTTTKLASGVRYYGYRYYLPELGKWPSRDPIGERGGINLYGMVENDIINRGDYLGLQGACSWDYEDAIWSGWKVVSYELNVTNVTMSTVDGVWIWFDKDINVYINYEDRGIVTCACYCSGYRRTFTYKAVDRKTVGVFVEALGWGKKLASGGIPVGNLAAGLMKVVTGVGGNYGLAASSMAKIAKELSDLEASSRPSDDEYGSVTIEGLSRRCSKGPQ
ncbi:RHS repeat-associated core domain-containing protein [Verrucomicrobiaceae bacterium 227]